MMSRALDLAARGVGQVSPGPLVGTVIVDPNRQIVGEGFYLFDEVKHAETLALEQAGDKARGATAYVSLEPHAHQGRTTPCTDALIKAGIKRVVSPIEDPNPKVSGRGFAHLRQAGIEVRTGLLDDEAGALNEAYIHFMRTVRPFVHLKMAVSMDGKVATVNGDSRWITGEVINNVFLDRVLMEQEQARLAAENTYLREEIKSDHNFEEIVGRSPTLLDCLDKVSRVAPTDASVLITGRRGPARSCSPGPSTRSAGGATSR